MTRSWSSVVGAVAVVFVTGVVVYGQQQPPAGGRGGGRGGGAAAGAPAVPALPQVSRTPPVDPAA